MPVRNVSADFHVSDDRGRTALERGPVVFCAEGTDNGGRALDSRVPDNKELVPEFRPHLLGGVMVITSRDSSFTAIPYFAWANRGATEMAVWLKK